MTQGFSYAFGMVAIGAPKAWHIGRVDTCTARRRDAVDMRAALQALHSAPAPSEEVNPPGSYPDIYGWGSDAEYIERLGFASCPHCGVHMSHGVLQDGDEKGDGTGKLIRLDTKYKCIECGKGFGGATERKTRKPATGTGTKIENGRDKQNGVTRPSAVGKCRAVWDGLDGLVAGGTKPTAAQVRELAATQGWDKTTAMVQFYQWRKFNGISGR